MRNTSSPALISRVSATLLRPRRDPANSGVGCSSGSEPQGHCVRATLKSVVAIAIGMLAACPSMAQSTGERIVRADAESGNWLSHGRTYDEQRYSPLASIDAA